jgi:AcrR family transcriptional regulator
MAPRPDVSEDRKKQILDASFRVFSRTGFEKTRMDDIAEESNVSKGLLYWYFTNKEEIIIAILDNLVGHEFKDFKKLPADGNARDQLARFLALMKTDVRLVKRITPIMFEFYSLAFRNRMVRKAIARYLNAYMEVMVPILRRGMERGEFPRLDPDETALAIGAALEGTFLIWAYDPARVDLEKQIDSGIRLVMRGLEPVHPTQGGKA